MIVKIDVLQDDIDDGEPRNACACAAWLAITRALPQFPGISVGTWHVSYYAGAELSRRLGESELPGIAQDFIGAADMAAPVRPFSFELDVPDDVLAAVSA